MDKFDKEIYGSYNDYPPNWAPIDEDKFWKKFCTYSWQSEEHRQMMRPDTIHMTMPNNNKYSHKPPVTCARLFLYSDGTGLAMVYQTKNASYTRPIFYQFAACIHEYVGAPSESFNCYHVSKCIKCGHKSAVDSSD